jgi:hypothetical protein
MKKRRRRGRKSSLMGSPTSELFLLAVLMIEYLARIHHQAGLS